MAAIAEAGVNATDCIPRRPRRAFRPRTARAGRRRSSAARGGRSRRRASPRRAPSCRGRTGRTRGTASCRRPCSPRGSRAPAARAPAASRSPCSARSCCGSSCSARRRRRSSTPRGRGTSGRRRASSPRAASRASRATGRRARRGRRGGRRATPPASLQAAQHPLCSCRQNMMLASFCREAHMFGSRRSRGRLHAARQRGGEPALGVRERDEDVLLPRGPSRPPSRRAPRARSGQRDAAGRRPRPGPSRRRSATPARASTTPRRARSPRRRRRRGAGEKSASSRRPRSGPTSGVVLRVATPELPSGADYAYTSLAPDGGDADGRHRARRRGSARRSPPRSPSSRARRPRDRARRRRSGVGRLHPDEARGARRGRDQAATCACRRRRPSASCAIVEELNADDAIDGILVQLPLPGADRRGPRPPAVHPVKDVDGFHPVNAGLLLAGRPPCPGRRRRDRAARRVPASIGGANAVVVGRSQIVGKPVAAPAAPRTRP